MDFLSKHFKTFKDEIQGIVSKLSSSQKISIVLLAFVVTLALILIVSGYAGSDGRVRFATMSMAQRSDVDAVKALLERHDIDVEERSTGENVELFVANDKKHQARWLVFESGDVSIERSNLEWLFDPPSIVGSGKLQKDRLEESKKRELEDMLRWSRNIRNVKIVIQKGPERVYAVGTNENSTAVVTIRLAPRVEKLASREARSIRLAAHGAFGIPPRNVQITDDRMNNYPFVDSSAELGDDGNKMQSEILGQIEKIYSHIFKPSEFVVGVLVDVSRRDSQIDERKFDDEPVSAVTRNFSETETSYGEGGAPRTQENTDASGGPGNAPPEHVVSDGQSRERLEQEYDVHVSETRTVTSVPAGEVEGVSVSLVMDQAAVINIIKGQEELLGGEQSSEGTSGAPGQPGAQVWTMGQKLDAYVKEQEKVIRNMIPTADAKVHVSTVMFPKPELPPKVGSVGRASAWLAGHWKGVVVALTAVIGIFAALMVFRRSIPASLEIPELDDHVLDEKGRNNIEEIDDLGTELRAVQLGHLNLFPGGQEQGDHVDNSGLSVSRDKVVESVEVVNSLAREKPQMVTSVLRNWLQDSVKDDS